MPEKRVHAAAVEEDLEVVEEKLFKSGEETKTLDETWGDYFPVRINPEPLAAGENAKILRFEVKSRGDTFLIPAKHIRLHAAFILDRDGAGARFDDPHANGRANGADHYGRFVNGLKYKAIKKIRVKPGGLQDIEQVGDHLNCKEWLNFLAFYNKYEKKNKAKRRNDFFEPDLVGSHWENAVGVTLTDAQIRAVTNDKKGLDAMRRLEKRCFDEDPIHMDFSPLPGEFCQINSATTSFFNGTIEIEFASNQQMIIARQGDDTGLGTVEQGHYRLDRANCYLEILYMQKADPNENADIQDAMINHGAQTFTGTDKFHLMVSPPFRPVVGDNLIRRWHTLDYRIPNRGFIGIISRASLIDGAFGTDMFQFQPFNCDYVQVFVDEKNIVRGDRIEWRGDNTQRRELFYQSQCDAVARYHNDIRDNIFNLDPEALPRSMWLWYYETTANFEAGLANALQKIEKTFRANLHFTQASNDEHYLCIFYVAKDQLTMMDATHNGWGTVQEMQLPLTQPNYITLTRHGQQL